MKSISSSEPSDTPRVNIKTSVWPWLWMGLLKCCTRIKASVTLTKSFARTLVASSIGMLKSPTRITLSLLFDTDLCHMSVMTYYYAWTSPAKAKVRSKIRRRENNYSDTTEPTIKWKIMTIRHVLLLLWTERTLCGESGKNNCSNLFSFCGSVLLSSWFRGWCRHFTSTSLIQNL